MPKLYTSITCEYCFMDSVVLNAPIPVVVDDPKDPSKNSTTYNVTQSVVVVLKTADRTVIARKSREIVIMSDLKKMPSYLEILKAFMSLENLSTIENAVKDMKSKWADYIS